MPFRSSGRGAYGPQGQRVIKGPLAPVWVTSGTLTGATTAPYSFQLQATDDSGDAPTYAIASGSLNPGLSLSSSGLISGTATGTTNTATFTVRATDVNGRFTDSGTLTLVATLAITYQIAMVGAGTCGPNTGSASRSGRGGFGVFTFNSTPGTALSITVGGGGQTGNTGNVGGHGQGGSGGAATSSGAGGTWIRYAGTVVAAVGGGGGGNYNTDFAGSGGGFNGNGGNGVDNQAPASGGGGAQNTGGSGAGGASAGSFLQGGNRGPDSTWSAGGGGGWYGGGGGHGDVNGQGGSPGGGGSGHLNIPAGMGTSVSIVANSGNGSHGDGGTVSGVGTYFTNGSYGASTVSSPGNNGAIRIWKSGVAQVEYSTPVTNQAITLP